MIYDILTLSFDGGLDGPNPGGTPRYGFVVRDGFGVVVGEGRGDLPGLPPEQRTNNTAEWEALCQGLAWVAALPSPVNELRVRGDSQLVVNGFLGRWRMRKPHLAAYARRALAIAETLDVGHLDVSWVPRGQNQYADDLAGGRPG